MQTRLLRQLPRARWGEALARYGAQHRGWIVSVRQRAGEDAPSTLVADAPLERISSEVGGPEGDAIRIEVGADHGGGRVAHRVAQPWLLLIAETPEREHVGLTIVSHDGKRTEVRFRTPVRPETVDDLP